MPQERDARSTQSHMDEVDAVLNDLLLRYGKDELRRRVHKVLEHLSDLDRYNEDLSQLPEGESEEYNHLVRQIVQTTQAYYSYMGSLPEDIRKSIMRMMEGDVNEETLQKLDILKIPNWSVLPSIRAIRPKNYIMQIDTISNQLATLGEQTRLTVGRKGNRLVTTTVTLDMPDHMKIEGGYVLTTYDKSILNGVTSLMESGNSVFSIPMLYHAMTGRKNPTVDEALNEEITARLERMRRMMLSIDLTEENEAHYLTDQEGKQLEVTDLQLEGYLLPLNKVSGLINGKQAELFQIIQHPPLYAYSKMKRQLASVKISLLNTPVNNTATTIPLKTYLLQRIEMMKNQNNHIASTAILYESIYQELGASDSGKTRKMRIRQYTTAILQYFVEQDYIQSYCEYRKGRRIAGVQIGLSGQ